MSELLHHGLRQRVVIIPLVDVVTGAGAEHLFEPGVHLEGGGHGVGVCLAGPGSSAPLEPGAGGQGGADVPL